MAETKATAGLTWALSEDGRSVMIDFPSTPPDRIRLSAGEVDEMLRTLGDYRAAMQPEVPRDHAFGQKVTAQTDPIWRSESELLNEYSLLHIRDPRFGWLHYLFPSPEAAKLAEMLQAQVASRRPLPPKAN